MINHLGTVIINSTCIHLRPFELGDNVELYDLIKDNDIAFFFPPANGVAEIKKFLASWAYMYNKKNFYCWAIIHDGSLIGLIKSVKIDEIKSICEIGYCIGTKYRNNGYAAKAVELISDFLLNSIGFKTILIKCEDINYASIHVAMKNSFSLIDYKTYSNQKEKHKYLIFEKKGF